MGLELPAIDILIFNPGCCSYVHQLSDETLGHPPFTDIKNPAPGHRDGRSARRAAPSGCWGDGQKPLGLPGLVNVYSLRTGKSPSEKLAKAIQRTQWLSFSSSRLPVIVYQVFSLSNWDNPQISDSGETDWMGVEGSWQHGRTCSWVWRTWKTHWPKMARSWWRSSRRTRMRLRHLRPLRHFKPLRQGSKVLKQ